jgi:membrane-bound inhibitor of C-type lysozyme
MDKKNFKTIFIALIAVLILVAFAWFSTKQLDNQPTDSMPEGQENLPVATSSVEQIKATFNCPDGRFIQVTFNNSKTSTSSVDLVLSDGRTISLPQVISADGARYANADESFVFWNVGDSASIQEQGTTTFVDCVTGANTSTSTASIIYTNNEFGFNFTLPASWLGYSIITNQWQGYAVSDTQGQVLYAQDPEISIRNPFWTAVNPYQDIPIMVFTLAQWNDLQADKFHIGAAPIGPSELGRNAKYVFALPARYNFAFPTGYEEVDQIIQSQPLKSF